MAATANSTVNARLESMMVLLSLATRGARAAAWGVISRR